MHWRAGLDRLLTSGSRIRLTRTRIGSAYAVAVVIDGLQFLLGPLGWAFADEALDVVAMAATSLLLGFHPLLLPTFVLELVPVADMIPSWTICVGLVVALRRRQPPTTGDTAPPIDIKPTSVT